MRLPDPARSRALLIGTARYSPASGLTDLPAVPNNLDDLYDVLADPRRGWLDPQSCTRILDPPSAGQLGIDIARQAALAEDLLFVYYAGHGLVSPRGELYLAVPSTDREHMRFTAFPYDGLREILNDSPAANRVVVLDCCYSGRALATMSDQHSPYQELDISGTYVLTSTTANEQAHAPIGARHTAFTGEMISLLRTGISEAPELITLDHLYRGTTRALMSRGLPRPQQRGSDATPHLALVRNAAFVPPTASAAAESGASEEPVPPTRPAATFRIVDTAGGEFVASPTAQQQTPPALPAPTPTPAPARSTTSTAKQPAREPSAARAVFLTTLTAVAQFAVAGFAAVIETAPPGFYVVRTLFMDPGLGFIYPIVAIGLLVFASSLAMRFGGRRVFTMGLVLFGGAIVVGGLAPNGAALTISVLIAGVGSPLIVIGGLYVSLEPQVQRAREDALAAYAAALIAGACIGTLIGSHNGLLDMEVRWRPVFMATGLVLILMAMLTRLGGRPQEADSSYWPAPRLALPGTLGLAATVYGCVGSARYGWSNPLVLVPLLLGIPLLLRSFSGVGQLVFFQVAGRRLPFLWPVLLAVSALFTVSYNAALYHMRFQIHGTTFAPVTVLAIAGLIIGVRGALYGMRRFGVRQSVAAGTLILAPGLLGMNVSNLSVLLASVALISLGTSLTLCCIVIVAASPDRRVLQPRQDPALDRSSMAAVAMAINVGIVAVCAWQPTYFIPLWLHRVGPNTVTFYVAAGLCLVVGSVIARARVTWPRT